MYLPTRRSLLVATIVVMGAACGGSDDVDRGDVAAVTSGDTGDVVDPTVPVAVSVDPVTTTSPPTSPATTEPTTTEPATTAPDTTAPDTTVPLGRTADEQAVSLALVDLASERSVDPDQITVIRFERVTWRDGSLGCPQPGMAYTQALVDGFRIELALGDETIWYHAGRSGEPFRCDDPQEPAPGGSGDT